MNKMKHIKLGSYEMQEREILSRLLLPEQIYCFLCDKMVRGCDHLEIKYLDDMIKTMHWLNQWADFDKHEGKTVINNIIQPFGEGYKQCILDVCQKLKEEIHT